MIHLSFRSRLKPALELQVVALCRAEPELSGAILVFLKRTDGSKVTAVSVSDLLARTQTLCLPGD